MHNNEIVKQTIFNFLNEIGILLEFATITEKTFLPGLQIKGNTIVIDTEKWLYMGDIIHEAGHIAVVPPADRATLEESTIGSRKDQAAEEMMAIAWSYAVCVHLQINPHIVFHENGYKGSGQNIVENFSTGNTFGVPMLHYTKMCIDSKNPTRKETDDCYPIMLQWMRPD
jgi:hypothetical protein